MDIYQVIKKPLITEKANLLKESGNQICLQVDRRANKVEIRRAVETLFKTEVIEVKTLNVMGKARRMGKNVGPTIGLEEGDCPAGARQAD